MRRVGETAGRPSVGAATAPRRAPRARRRSRPQSALPAAARKASGRSMPSAGSPPAPPPRPRPRSWRRARRREAPRRSTSCARSSTSFDGCALKATATQLVFADGNPQARVMFVGEAPGRDEDIEGLPFVGRSGKLLDRCWRRSGSTAPRSISPTSCRGGRPATARRRRRKSQICLPFIQRQIELADPDMLVCLGGPSSADAARRQGGHH